jgi:hypothetical protein
MSKRDLDNVVMDIRIIIKNYHYVTKFQNKPAYGGCVLDKVAP